MNAIRQCPASTSKNVRTKQTIVGVLQRARCGYYGATATTAKKAFASCRTPRAPSNASAGSRWASSIRPTATSCSGWCSSSTWGRAIRRWRPRPPARRPQRLPRTEQMKALLRPLSWLPRPFGERAGVMGRTGHILTARALTPTLSRGANHYPHFCVVWIKE